MSPYMLPKRPWDCHMLLSMELSLLFSLLNKSSSQTLPNSKVLPVTIFCEPLIQQATREKSRNNCVCCNILGPVSTARDRFLLTLDQQGTPLQTFFLCGCFRGDVQCPLILGSLESEPKMEIPEEVTSCGLLSGEGDWRPQNGPREER